VVLIVAAGWCWQPRSHWPALGAQAGQIRRTGRPGRRKPVAQPAARAATSAAMVLGRGHYDLRRIEQQDGRVGWSRRRIGAASEYLSR
jgi:hypothetical protein